VPRIVVTLLLYPALQLVVGSGSPVLFIVVFAVLMAPHAMSSAASIVLIPKIFPPLVRTSGLSIAYALGVTLFGGTAQVAFTWIINATGDKLSWIWYIIAMSIISLISTVLIRVPNTWSAGKIDPGLAPAIPVKVTT
jgi:nitrate/nitrite transporter NarK